MAIKYLDINQVSNLIPVTEEGNFLETVKNKIISIIEKIEQFIDKILFKLREEGLVIKKHRQTLIKHASEVNDIEMDLLKFEPEKIVELCNCLPGDDSNIDDMNKAIEYMKKYDADFISKNTVKTTIGECDGGIIGLIMLTDSMGKNYLKFKSVLREKKRRIKGQHKEISKEVYSTLMQMYNLYGSTISRLCLTQYRNFHAAITKATNKAKTFKEFATCGICDEFNAFMEINFGLNEATATDYKTIDISDCGGVDITDTISGNFDNWEGIIPDNTIGDITAEFDDFLESTFDSMDFDNDYAINEQFDQMIGRVMLESDSSSKVSKLKSELEKTCVGKTEHQIDAILYKYYKLCRGKAVAAIIGGGAGAGAVVGAIAGGITAGGAGAAAGAAGGAMFGGVAGCYVYIFIASYYIGKLNKFNIPLLKKRRRIEKIIYDTEDLLEKARDKNKTKEAKELESLLRKERRELDRLQRITSDKVQKVNSAGAYSESTGLPNITAEFDEFLESSGLLTEGMYRDNQISAASHGDYGDFEIDMRDIAAIDNFFLNEGVELLNPQTIFKSDKYDIQCNIKIDDNIPLQKGIISFIPKFKQNAKKWINSHYQDWYASETYLNYKNLSKNQVQSMVDSLFDTIEISYNLNNKNEYLVSYWINNYGSHKDSKYFFGSHDLSQEVIFSNNGKIIKINDIEMQG